jgi:hypothetical protein
MDTHEREMLDRCYPVDEDIALQRRIWRFERIGWYALVIVVALTLCGLFSHGALSSATATSSAKDLVVEYERFHRSGAVNPMIIHSRGVPGQTHTVFISEDMLEGFSIDSMQPQPVGSTGSRQGLRLRLMGDSQGESALYLAWRSDGIGVVKSEIAIDGGGKVSLTQFIYP